MIPHRRQHHRPAFTLLMVVGLFALVTGTSAILSVYAVQLLRADRYRVVDDQLRQMIDSGIAYAQLHREGWPQSDDPVTLDARHLAHNRLGAIITITPIRDTDGDLNAVTVHSQVQLRSGRTRSMTIHANVAKASRP